MKNIKVYPISIEYVPEETNHPYFVEVPDLNLATEADSVIHGILMARELIGLYSFEHDLPKSNVEIFTPKNNNTIVTLLDIDIDQYQQELSHLNKTL